MVLNTPCDYTDAGFGSQQHAGNITRSVLCCAADGASLLPADDADFGGDLLETVQETQNDEEEQALTGSQVSYCRSQCMWSCAFTC